MVRVIFRCESCRGPIRLDIPATSTDLTVVRELVAPAITIHRRQHERG